MASWLLLPAHAFTMASPQRVKLDELLSTCVDASLRGCAEIRRVQAQRVSGGAAALTIMEAKDEQELAGQYLTEADLAAQAAIVAALEAAWPGLRIVGEEELVCDFVCDEEVCGKKKESRRLAARLPLDNRF